MAVDQFVNVVKDEGEHNVVIGKCKPVTNMTTYNNGMKISRVSADYGAVDLTGASEITGSSGYSVPPHMVVIPSSQAANLAGWPTYSGYAFNNRTNNFQTTAHA